MTFRYNYACASYIDICPDDIGWKEFMHKIKEYNPCSQLKGQENLVKLKTVCDYFLDNLDEFADVLA
jgi:hypothetical protein